MKYIVILGDGMADYPLESLGGKTPLDVAKKPNIDRLCQNGEIGLVKTVPQGMKPGSDVANLAMMGYSPRKYYSGRSPLEALSIGIDLLDDDIAIRCNLVTLSDEKSYADKTMVDYSSGEISTAEASELISFVQSN
ncbi:MAG: phosphoglycerate mutase, partial [Clostridia bacterium]